MSQSGRKMDQQLELAAWEAMSHAYAPYSNFKVGAALETASGTVVTGCNVENSSFSLGICAERLAIFRALTLGEQPGPRLKVVTEAETPTPPCGACREILRQLAPQTEVVSLTRSGKSISWAAGELLPDALPAPDDIKAGPRQTIIRKRDGHELETDEIRGFIDGLISGSVTYYQMSAFMMAVYLKGMSQRETRDLTASMLASGTQLDFSHLDKPVVDKHSTGGVGDRISIPLFPLTLAAGLHVPMISGRGLGHTGGTLDKLDSIPGYRTKVPIETLNALVPKLGGFMAGQTGELVPADQIMYGLRDVTGTVSTIPLIVGSILSKKLAAGLNGLVLDVKFGRGAFMPDQERAEELARALVETAGSLKLPAVALLTRMDDPIGMTIGNALEIRESMELLGTATPAEDFRELTCALGGLMTSLAGLTRTMAEGAALIEEKRTSGAGAEMAKRWIEIQGGDPGVVENPELAKVSEVTADIPAAKSGYIQGVDALMCGELCVRLGGGRRRMEEAINTEVGIVLHKRRGDQVSAGESLATLYLPDPSAAQSAILDGAELFEIGEKPPTEKKQIVALVTQQGMFTDPWDVPILDS